MTRSISLLLIILSLSSTVLTQSSSTTEAGVTSGENLLDLQYYLWTPENHDWLSYDVVLKDVESLMRSNFNPKLKSKVIVHGFGSTPHEQWIFEMKDAFFKHGDYNIFSVDYTKYCQGPISKYPQAVKNVPKVGETVADFINFLVDTFDLSLDDFHPIGFSLGGQVVGAIGESLNGALPRISALDPAGLGFYRGQFENKLSKDDAGFVDVIYTTGYWVGTQQIVGDANFYPNGGVAHQPGCDGPGDQNAFLSCSHQRAPDTYTESINSELGFKAIECESWEHFDNGTCFENEGEAVYNWMGFPANPNISGNFYLKTNSKPPFAVDLEPSGSGTNGFKTSNVLVLVCLLIFSSVFG